MKAFWWFKDNSIAGMARPGFNGVRWFDLPFDETLVFGWIGQRSCGVEPVHSLKQHFSEYGSKIRSFHKVDEASFRRVCDDFEKPGKIAEAFQKVADRTNCIERFEVSGDQISFKLSGSRLASEIEFLKQNKISSVVTLTEQHNQQEELNQHFDLHHLAIDWKIVLSGATQLHDWEPLLKQKTFSNYLRLLSQGVLPLFFDNSHPSFQS
ncbi:MAG: hypothetical protein ACXWRE_13475 [Pseudobdellovibrionaceae bacterium]